MPIPPWLALVLKEAPGLAVKYGPAALAWAREHPEVIQDVVAQARRTRPSSRRDGASGAGAEDLVDAVVLDETEDLGETIALLREQVAYLLESADDTAERERAVAWGGKLDRLARAERLMVPGRASSERAKLHARVEALRAEIVAAFLVEKIEDAGGPSPSDADR